MTLSDLLTFFDIIVTALVGIHIATSIQNNFAKKRALKDYFISELTVLLSDYRHFVNEIWSAKLNSKSVKDTFKVLSGRIDSLDRFLHENFTLEQSLIKDAHVKFQQEATGVDELGDQYNNEFLTLKPETKARLMPYHNELADAITRRVIDINQAKLKKKKCRK